MGWLKRLFGPRETPVPPELEPFVRAGAGRYGWLRLTSASPHDLVIPLDHEQIVLGYRPDLYKAGPAQHVRLEFQGVSRLNSLLTMTDAGYEIVDLGSTCGTMVNGSRMTKVTLIDGDYVRIGEATFQLVYLRTSPFALDRPGKLPPKGIPIGAVRGPQCDTCASTHCEVKALPR